MAAPRTSKSKNTPRTAPKSSPEPLPPEAPDDGGDEDANLPELDELASVLGPSTEAEVLTTLALTAADKPKLVTDGASVWTPRITKDARRIYARAHAVLTEGTEAQRAAVVSITLDTVRVAVFSARRGRDLHAALEERGRAAAGSRKAGEAALAERYPRATAARTQLVVIAAGLYGARSTAVQTAAGTIKSAADVEASIERLCVLIAKGLRSKDKATVERRKHVVCTPATLSSARALAAAAHEAERKATAPLKGSTSQGELDYWDGLNLELLDRVLKALDVAQRAEPTIGTVVAISVRDRLRGKRATKKKPAPIPAPAPKG